MIRMILAVLALALVVWLMVDVNQMHHADLRKFDPHVVARVETDMWRSTTTAGLPPSTFKWRA